jgi:hypothetical protein
MPAGYLKHPPSMNGYRGLAMKPAQRPSAGDLLRVMAVFIPFVIAPLWAIAFAERRFEPYQHVGWAWRLLLSLPLAAVLMAFVARVGRPVFARTASPGIAAFSVLCAMPPLAFQLVGYVNVAADRDPGRMVTVDCVRVIHRTKGRNEVEVTSWKDPGRTLTFWNFLTDKPDCDARKPVRIVVHPGRLGAEWITRAR